jgi:uncharacterized protein (DUF2147 family)
MKRLTVIAFLSMLLIAAALQADSGRATGADGIVGIWLTGKQEAKIEIFRCGGAYCGKIVWTNDPVYTRLENELRAGQPRTDDNNPAPAMRRMPILGLRMIYNLKYAGGNDWTGGRIYDPESGNTYSANFSLVSKDRLELRGYFLVSFFGKTTTWTRVK